MVKKVFAKSYVWLMLLIMYAPILTLIVFSFTESKNIGSWTGFSFKLYRDMFKNEEIVTALVNTIIVAVSAGIVSTILGTFGAIGIYYCTPKAKRIMNGLSQIPVMNAEIVTAISLTILFVSFGVKFNFFTLLVGHVVLTVPFVVLSVMPKLKQMDPNIYEAALDLGATPKKALWSVVIPEILPGIFSGFMLTITLSLDDYIITAFTRDNSFSTLSTYVYGATAKKGALPPTLRALTTVITLIVLGILIIINVKTKNKKVVNRRGRI